MEFFEKDPVEWQKFEYSDFYKTLLSLKKNNYALWNGKHGGLSKRINVSDRVYAFKREKNGHQCVGILNLSDQDQVTTLFVDIDEMTDVFTGAKVTIHVGSEIILGPWEYLLLE